MWVFVNKFCGLAGSRNRVVLGSRPSKIVGNQEPGGLMGTEEKYLGFICLQAKIAGTRNRAG